MRGRLRDSGRNAARMDPHAVEVPPGDRVENRPASCHRPSEFRLLPITQLTCRTATSARRMGQSMQAPPGASSDRIPQHGLAIDKAGHSDGQARCKRQQ